MRALKGLVLAAAITPLLGACVIYDSSADEAVTVRVANGNTSVAVAAPLETLRSVRFEPGALVIQADSGGCTREASFAVRITDGDGPAQISLTRETPDNCEAHLANGVELRWTYEELGLASGQAAVIQNPVRLP